MKLLIDTHTYLWFIQGHSRLSTQARAFIEDTSNTVYLSIASAWEIAIKVSIGKLVLHQPLDKVLSEQLTLNDITLLDITLQHTLAAAELPLHHRDPFDRMLAVQALSEALPFISNDAIFDQYGVQRVW